ncbi:MAG: response regulator [Deltaproteobacteria bacterium]|nr:response regulator [Deltaproteobacteria bacterium]
MKAQSTILCVDDDRIVLNAMQRALSTGDTSYRILTAGSGLEAVEIMGSEVCDVAVIDLYMPEMSGLELLEIIKKTSPETETVILTGDTTPETVVTAMKAGAWDYLTKPFSYQRLRTTVQNAVQKQRLVQRNRELHEALSQSGDQTFSRETLRVLIVDDSQDDREVTKRYLRNATHPIFDITEAESAEEALESFVNIPPDCILLDYNLPDATGLELLERLLAMNEHLDTAVVMLTGQGREEVAVQAMKAGVNDYLIKGRLTVSSLCASICNAMEKVDMMRSLRQQETEKIELIRELKESRDSLTFDANHDPLTGILNRRAIMEQFQKEIGRIKRKGGFLSIGLCDLDHFKRINDTFGHQVGDDVLIGFISRAKETMRDYDSIGRYGGEEFLIICTDYCENRPFERLRAALANNPIDTRAGEVPVTVSIGVTTVSGKDDPEAAIAIADAALYRAKKDGRNRVVVLTITGFPEGHPLETTGIV